MIMDKYKEVIMRIILASGSPRRKEILSNAGYEFEIIKSEKEEIITKTVPADVVKELSSVKAEDVETRLSGDEDYMIIGADTVVAVDDAILGKPHDRTDAYNMISKLSGREHKVYTGVTVIINKDGDRKEIIFAAETKVTVASMSRDEIEEYISLDEPYDKAGAYAIQGKFAKYITSIDGEYNNVVGFPIAAFYKVLKDNKCIL